MRRLRSSLLPGLLALLLCPALAGAQETEPTERPFLWIVEGGEAEAPSFLFGTIHIPDDRVLALPDVVDEALERAEALNTELPMDPASQMGMQRKATLPRGRTLEDVLPEDLYERTDAYLQTKGLSLRMLGRFKVWALATQLSLLDYLPEMQRGKQPLDAELYSRAEEAGMEVGGLEEVEEQIGVFEALTTEEQIEMLRSSLDQLEDAAEEHQRAIAPLIEAYLGGDLDALWEAAMASNTGMDAETEEKFRNRLIYDRNERMASRMAARIREEPSKSWFFAVGSAHYPTERGIVALLEDEGFSVRRLTPEDAGTIAEPAAAGKD